jgi:hypothetical protein
MQCWDFDEAKENASIEHDADGLGVLAPRLARKWNDCCG